mmetsp:Transcript_11254/g.31363  ORF Transcript_11254/g.31363 Transcript_11254/m.31363 type:complete len:268 (-) Transcript_11254:65-868(-)
MHGEERLGEHRGQPFQLLHGDAGHCQDHKVLDAVFPRDRGRDWQVDLRCGWRGDSLERRGAPPFREGLLGLHHPLRDLPPDALLLPEVSAQGLSRLCRAGRLPPASGQPRRLGQELGSSGPVRHRLGPEHRVPGGDHPGGEAPVEARAAKQVSSLLSTSLLCRPEPEAQDASIRPARGSVPALQQVPLERGRSTIRALQDSGRLEEANDDLWLGSGRLGLCVCVISDQQQQALDERLTFLGPLASAFPSSSRTSPSPPWLSRSSPSS